MAPITSVLLCALAPAALAFAPATGRRAATSLRMSAESPDKLVPDAEEVEAVFEETASRVNTAAARGENEMGYVWDRALPWMAAPKYSSFGIAAPADAKFDPLGFADTEEKFNNLRDAELKHCRLAMLAAAGWPLSELNHNGLSESLNLPNVLAAGGRAPSVLNGGLGNINLAYWAAILGAAAAIELVGMKKAGPGDYGFDPLGLADKIGEDWVATAEVKNGRLAMIAITAFAFQEFVSQIPVVKETPLFFEPLGTYLREYQNTGYLPVQ
uniref:Uncharacterized protein n=1 Tax=Pinguiococcus pyrenoidosus TaxID=172671 RepID=A0A7R9U4F0_9STRA|eukprot:scaffold228_cov312-Pinguiococcus_pyrenoidosus.AAC.65